MIAMVLLSNSSAEYKAIVILQLYKQKNQPLILNMESDINEIFSTIAQVSLKIIPKMAMNLFQISESNKDNS